MSLISSSSRIFGHGHQWSQDDLHGQIDAINKSQAVAQFDLHGNILDANQNFLDVMGYSLDDIEGKHHAIFVDEQTRNSREYTAFWQKLGEGEHDMGCYKRIKKNGDEVWLQASYNPIFDRHGKPVRVIKYATDVTDQQLRNAETQGELAAISKVQAIVEFELDGTIIWANDLFLGLVGYTNKELAGQHHKMLVSADERNTPQYAEFWQQLASGQFHTGHYRRIGKDGREVWLDASYNPILDASGRPFKVVKYATDATRRYTAAQMLEAAVQGLKGTVERASQASDLAKQGHAVAEEGGQNVEHAVTSMQAITDSSHRISEIIGVMDNIAFQTNILALNAAVEAARAGHHGRGFAVVASEVRNLAQSSAAAAREVRELIKTSAEHVDKGAKTVQSAGTVMQDITASSHKVAEIMDEVAQEAIKQSQMLDQVTADLTR